MSDNEYFMPISIDKKLWDSAADKMVFINSVYTHQLDEMPAEYLTVYPTYTYDYHTKQNIIDELIAMLVPELNGYIGINEDFVFWRKMLYRWVACYVASVYFTVEQLDSAFSDERLRDKVLYTLVPNNRSELVDAVLLDGRWGYDGELSNEDYRVYLYAYLLERDHSAQIELREKEMARAPKLSIAPSTAKPENRLVRLLKRARKATPRKVYEKLRLRYYRLTGPQRMRAGVYSVPLFADTTKRWLFESAAAVQPLDMPAAAPNMAIDREFRARLATALRADSALDRAAQVALELLPAILPRDFVELFRANYEIAERYLAEHPQLRVVYTETGSLGNDRYTILMLLLQKRGGKIIGEQHGGNYQVEAGISSQEEYIDDIFCFWGAGAADYPEESCQIVPSAPCYKLSSYDGAAQAAKYVLFLGTAVCPYPIYLRSGAFDQKNEEYIARKVRFLKALDRAVFSNTKIREYYVDFGYHVEAQLERECSGLWSDGFGDSESSFGDVDMVGRDASFRDSLLAASLLVVDHVSTTWLEALYVDKPFIMMVQPGYYTYREQEQPYIELMREAGIIQDSPEAAAAIVSRIYGHEREWWEEPERYRLVEQLRQRYTTRVDDIDAWWRDRLLAEADRLDR